MTKKKHSGILSLPKVVTIAALAMVATLTIDFGRRALDNYHVQRQVEWLRDEVAREQEVHAALQEELAYVSSDAYVEKVARENLKMVKPGDKPVVVVPANREQAAAPPAPVFEVQEAEPLPYWQQWWELFLGTSGPNP